MKRPWRSDAYKCNSAITTKVYWLEAHLITCTKHPKCMIGLIDVVSQMQSNDGTIRLKSSSLSIASGSSKNKAKLNQSSVDAENEEIVQSVSPHISTNLCRANTCLLLILFQYMIILIWIVRLKMQCIIRLLHSLSSNIHYGRNSSKCFNLFRLFLLPKLLAPLYRCLCTQMSWTRYFEVYDNILPFASLWMMSQTCKACSYWI